MAVIESTNFTASGFVDTTTHSWFSRSTLMSSSDIESGAKMIIGLMRLSLFMGVYLILQIRTPSFSGRLVNSRDGCLALAHHRSVETELTLVGMKNDCPTCSFKIAFCRPSLLRPIFPRLAGSLDSFFGEAGIGWWWEISIVMLVI